ncbi:HaeIII family restriction endonuclease [Limosilactobacillus reuteri]|uniref:HaeIII family restriction endonuclease n=1 Tax=Limosilactobacillus reuteri TaxID=1598 RepID=UPI000D6F3D91|nr:HaeIII family restriction endonuclease [Limosilactobacillus reuteri]PWT39202.1 HaeIII family restriction endonuclease [Limosilactobacillus reuteri]
MTNTKTGKAFEYACLVSLYNRYSKLNINVRIIDTPQLNTAKTYFYNLSKTEQTNYIKAGVAGVKIIDLLEPKLQFSNSSSLLELTLQTDKQGQTGDVRDVLCIRNDKRSWSIGLSCKHNHFALKHPRLSPSIDFGKDWLGHPCSQQYFTDVNNIFNPLSFYIKNKILWKNTTVNKVDDVYKPLLIAFMEEFKRIYSQHTTDVPRSLVKYLIGENDFYKVIDLEKEKATLVLPVNFNKSLNIPYQSHKSLLKIGVPKLPSVVYHIGFKQEFDPSTNSYRDSDNTIIITCDEGWTFSMRIHNASSKIENSLKFDVEAISTPDSMRYFVQPWQ